MTEKEQFLQRFNEAFAAGDIEHLARSVTDDFRWRMVGDKVVEGKENFVKILESMSLGSECTFRIEHIITHGKMAAVNGVIQAGKNGKTYAFCDVCVFNSFKDALLKEMTSYNLEDTTAQV